MVKKLPPVHPGEVLREDFLRPMKLTAYAVAKAVGVPRTRIERLVREETPVTADTALRLARYFGTKASFWMGLQAQYDFERAPARGRVRSYSTTSSASASSVGGTSRPSDFAVFRLRTNRNRVGCSNGSSAGFAPFRMRSTRAATRTKLSLWS